jgi:hypothetical protein
MYTAAALLYGGTFHKSCHFSVSLICQGESWIVPTNGMTTTFEILKVETFILGDCTLSLGDVLRPCTGLIFKGQMPHF